MNSCSNHKKDVAGIADMKQLAQMIGDLHYETLTEFLLRLREKLADDAKIDADGNRTLLSKKLWLASGGIYTAYVNICIASSISKRFMEDNAPSSEQEAQ